MKSIYLGVDGGQSSTTAVIGDQAGAVIGFGRGGPCNHVGASEGRAKFVAAIEACVGDACQQAGLGRAGVPFAAACLGFSGGPADKKRILEEMIGTERLIVTHDALIALSGATAGNPGIVTISGTGSIAFGRDGSGRSARAGGWGYVFGDEGGGFDLTRRALRAALRFEEGWGPATVLRARLLDASGAESANDLLHRFYTVDFPRPRIASFSRLVDEAAESGDAAAAEILREAAAELARLAMAVRGQLFAAGDQVLIAYIGGVFGSRRLLEHFRALLESAAENRVAAPIHGPAAGALLEAYRAAGLHPALRNVPVEK